MKVTLSLLTLALSTLIAADGLSFGASFAARDLSAFGKQKALGDGGAVPGDNPLTYCKKDHDDDLLKLEKVNLTPNPPVKYVVPLPCATSIFQNMLQKRRWNERCEA